MVIFQFKLYFVAFGYDLAICIFHFKVQGVKFTEWESVNVEMGWTADHVTTSLCISDISDTLSQSAIKSLVFWYITKNPNALYSLYHDKMTLILVRSSLSQILMFKGWDSNRANIWIYTKRSFLTTFPRFVYRFLQKSYLNKSNGFMFKKILKLFICYY